MSRVNTTETRFNFWVQKECIEQNNETSEVVVGDIPWKIKICKQSDGKENVIKASLIGDEPVNLENSDWLCEAMAKISVLSPTTNQPCNETILPTTKFNKNCLSSDSVDFIRYNKLTDLTQYEHNEQFVFDVKILMNPIKYFPPSVLDQKHTKFQYTVENVNQTGRNRSPEVALSGVSWFISLGKEEKEGKETSMAVYLYSKIDARNRNWSWPVKVSISLLSFDENVEPITQQLKKYFCRDATNWGYSSFVDWNTLTNPTKKYVKDNTAIFEIDLEVGPPKPLTDFKQNSSKQDVFECSICLQSVIGRDPVATKCGHMFCEACIELSMEDNKQCPNCKADVVSEEFRKIYL